ncbi:LacI family DNA-binding transcriptional regulator [Labedella endophytica]|nr:LacI family DNA-binding transcriptional regulator [Labedella endophytica]
MREAAPGPQRRATRADVARRAGVSDAVVTYTLNGGAPVARATAERVLQAVADLGYQPNQAARALKSGSAHTLGLILPDGPDPVFENPFFTEFANAVEAAARRRGYALYMTPTPPDQTSVVTRLNDFATRQVDGVLVVPGEGSLDPDVLDRIGIPWLQLNTVHEQVGVDSIGADLLGGAVLATEHLIAHGHRQVAFVGEIDEREPRYRGWLATCERLGVERGPALPSEYNRQSGYAAGLEIAAMDRPPAAVFAASDLIALGVLRALHERGVSVPDDVALVSFDGSWEAEYSWPALTSVRQPIEEMAEASVAAILDRTAPDERRHRMFRGELVLRASCGVHRPA